MQNQQYMTNIPRRVAGPSINPTNNGTADRDVVTILDPLLIMTRTLRKKLIILTTENINLAPQQNQTYTSLIR